MSEGIRQIATPLAAPAIGPYCQGVVSNGLLFCSGAIPLSVDGEIVGATPAEQATRCLENHSAVADEAGTGLDRSLRLTVFTTRLDAFAEINDAYAAVIKHTPARAVVGVADLPKGVLVEIDAIIGMP